MYVNEPEETLSVCLEPTQDLDARIQQVFNTYMSAMDVLVSDPVTLMGSSYTTSWHRIIITEELWHGLILVSRPPSHRHIPVADTLSCLTKRTCFLLLILPLSFRVCFSRRGRASRRSA